LYDIIIIGGGLAGLTSAISLAKAGYKVLALEKKTFPFHKVCGEYVSNEVVGYLKSLEAFPELLQPAHIHKLVLSSVSGAMVNLPLPLGGFGLSRQAFDAFLFQKAKQVGVAFWENTHVSKINFDQDCHHITTSCGREMQARLVIGAYGKRSVLDKQFNRSFIQKHSDFIGVKYHIQTDFPKDTIALHHFPGGYCGLVKIEADAYNLCYLGSRSDLRKHGSVENMEAALLMRNPYLKSIFEYSTFLHSKPLVINEVSFSPKPLIENHVLMCGDAAGLITPVCGNGMAIAIHAAKLLSDLVKEFYKPGYPFYRDRLENAYYYQWNKCFQTRLKVGRYIQGLFLKGQFNEWLIRMVGVFPFLAHNIVKRTHGKPF
jgi:menaquinone-9 beta-reductase